MRRRRLLLLLALPLAQLAACGPGAAGVSDPARPIRVRPGQAFAIALKANPTTGYAWRVAAPLPAPVALVESRYYPGPGAAAHLMGAGGREVLTFRAVAAGRGQIRLAYVQAGSGATGRTAAFTVIVR